MTRMLPYPVHRVSSHQGCQSRREDVIPLCAETVPPHAGDLRLGPIRHTSAPCTSEGLFGTFKNEMYSLRGFATRQEAKAAVVEYIEGYYNRRRPHSTVGYRIPAELMHGFFERTARCNEGVTTLPRDSLPSCVRNLDTAHLLVFHFPSTDSTPRHNSSTCSLMPGISAGAANPAITRALSRKIPACTSSIPKRYR